MGSVNTKIKKKKKNITLGIICIVATFNNTIVTFTDIQGNVFASSSAGAQGFGGARKATPYAAQMTVDKVSQDAKDHGLKTVSIRIKGAGVQRESAMRAIFNQNFVVTSITDVSGVPHNGVRPPKRRRI
jgi:small subunit ribosomal protein S11